jgi:hypothetical protein
MSNAHLFGTLAIALACAGCAGVGATSPGGGSPDAARPGWDAGPSPSPGDPTFELGAFPEGMSVAWPAAPMTTREVSVTTTAEANREAATAGTRIRVTGALAGTVSIAASDVELLLAEGASIEHLMVQNRLSRILVRGGRFGAIELQIPGTYYPAEEWHREWMVTDLLIDRVDVDSADTAFLMRAGIRIAITNSHGRAARYNVWFGDSADFESEDVILAGNVFDSAGPEATVRLVHTRRSATVANRLVNTLKHNYRTHGRSEFNWASRNVMVNSGVMLGTLPDDVVGRQWLESNTFYHDQPSLADLDRDIATIYIRDNVVYSNVWNCLVCMGYPDTWEVANNTVMPYQAPPP